MKQLQPFHTQTMVFVVTIAAGVQATIHKINKQQQNTKHNSAKVGCAGFPGGAAVRDGRWQRRVSGGGKHYSDMVYPSLFVTARLLQGELACISKLG
ncbi:unnamed protein product [Ceratitis capitata]|uniref:(Mediterranean fruit fly) hypothetical protein n=1 Tax=Ceratitis capitata TaxID=7213 RepID=A0A811UK32_CERCA|nr:unnamed protein product [Ceratitis capitata]